MPDEEGLALYEAGKTAARVGPLFELGSYRGRSTVYLGGAAAEAQVKLYTLDHHRGSEEHQVGEGFHDPEVYVEREGRIDTLPSLLDTIARAGLGDVVVPLVGEASAIAPLWTAPLGLVFVDGGHSREAAHADYEGWAPHVVSGGLLVIHDVFEDPSEGGRPPFEIYSRALESGAFEERCRTGSLRVLERIGDGI